ncbi:MAG: hypothetical protein KDK75_12460 [Alphaproteobacteria bacterium]|nr:hypothetical protein [Alphaproteobacteria bacterium]
MSLPDPVFPPLLSGHAVDAESSAFAEARAGVEVGRYGAGDLLWSRREDQLDCALVLEPDVVLEQAIQMAPLVMVAIGDALGAIGPPNLAIMYRWPFDIFANGGHVGEVCLGLPAGAQAGSVPAHLIVGVRMSIFRRAGDAEPGHDVARTMLHEEGAGDLDRTQLLETLSRHTLSWIDRWESEGFEPLGELWLLRAADRGGTVSAIIGGGKVAGQFAGLDSAGSLLLDTAEGQLTVPLTDAVLAGHKAAHD